MGRIQLKNQVEDSTNALGLTKMRLKNFKNYKTLKKITIDNIIKSLNSDYSLNEQNYIHTKLSPEMRDRVLQVILRRKNIQNKVAKYIPTLLNSHTKELNLIGILNQPSDYVCLPYVDEVLYTAACLAPNLERLNCPRAKLLWDCFHRASTYAFFSLITNFKKLQILEMQRLLVDLPDIAFLCGNLPNLKVVKFNQVHCVPDSFSREEISRPLSNLRLLCIENNEETQGAIWQHLPNLDIAPDLNNTSLDFNDFLDPEDKPESPRKIFTCDQTWFDFPDPNAHIKYPKVVHLNVNVEVLLEDADDLVVFPKFTKIESIDISGGVLTYLYRILHQYGQNLRLLFLNRYDIADDVSDDNCIYDIHCVFNLCPRLENLTVLDIYAKSNAKTPMENTLELKEIHLTPFQQSFTILLAANLRIVELSQIVLEYERAEEIRNIASLIAQKSILLELQVLRLQILTDDMASTSYTNFVHLIKNASAFLPILTELKLSVDLHDYVNLARTMKSDGQFKAKFFSERNIVDVYVPDVFLDEQLINILALYQK